MKNIHILPTDQPSRLHLWTDENGMRLALCELEYSHTRNTQHIYITSDEEIKKGDWYLDTFKNEIRKAQLNLSNDKYKKIILTTDPTLIEDGIQAIDDNFLEWFVKNSSCEFVEVNKKLVEFPLTFKMMYKIIIPQEEPKQEKEEEYFKHLEKDKKEFAKEWEEIRQEFGFGKKDTLEEAAEKYANEWEEIHPTLDPEDMTPIEVSKIDFIAGAKWQADQLFKDDAIQTLEKGLALLLKKQERMYSEEEVLNIILKFNDDKPGGFDASGWFEQFKKK